MEGSIIVGKSGSRVINLDAVQCGVARDKENVLSFFAKVVKKVREKTEITDVPAPIKVHDNKVTIKDNGVVNRFIVNKEKKAKILSKSRDKELVARVMRSINQKYGHTNEKTPNR